MSFVMTLNCGNDVDGDKKLCNKSEDVQIPGSNCWDWDADEEDKEANGGIEGGDLLYQIPVCIECPLWTTSPNNCLSPTQSPPPPS